MWCIPYIVTWSSVKYKIIIQRSNIFIIDSVVSIKLSPELQERSSKVELLTIGSVFWILLFVNVYWWELTWLLIALFLCHIGTMLTLLVMKVFLLNISKSNSRELLMIGIVSVRYSSSPTIYGTVDPCELFKSCSLKCFCSLISNCSSSKLKFHQERINKYTCLWNFHILKY